MYDILHGIRYFLFPAMNTFSRIKSRGRFMVPKGKVLTFIKKKPSESEEVKIENQMEWNQESGIRSLRWQLAAAGLHGGQLEDFSNDVHRCKKSRNKTANFSAVEKSS